MLTSDYNWHRCQTYINTHIHFARETWHATTALIIMHLFKELMGLREDKVELVARLFSMEKEKSALELKLKCLEGQHKAQNAALKNLQGQLKDTEAVLALATQNKVGILKNRLNNVFSDIHKLISNKIGDLNRTCHTLNCVY